MMMTMLMIVMKFGTPFPYNKFVRTNMRLKEGRIEERFVRFIDFRDLKNKFVRTKMRPKGRTKIFQILFKIFQFCYLCFKF